MRNALIYTGLFLTSFAIQLLVLDPVHVWMYMSPLVYAAFVILLPVNMLPVVVLLLGLVAGVVMDFFSGMGGLHTVVTLFTAYIRQYVMIFTLGKEYADDGGMPSIKLFGVDRFMRYASVMVAAHCFLYFTLESLTWRFFHIVVLKTAVSGAVTLLFVWLISLLFTIRTRKKA